MSQADSEELLRRAPVGRLGTSWQDEPYVVPVNFVYDEGRLYFHCAKEGRKMEYMLKNPRVCFEVDEFTGVKGDGRPCSLDACYTSVIAFGEAKLIESTEEKREKLTKLVAKYAEDSEPVFDEEELRKVSVVEVLVTKISGKHCLP